MKRDNLSDLILCICLVIGGIIVGWRLYYLTHDYSDPTCIEDEWIYPDTGECVHVETILEGR